jgi:hypothetical protein
MRKFILFPAIACFALASIPAADASGNGGANGGDVHHRDSTASAASKPGGKTGVSTQGTKIGTTGGGDGITTFGGRTTTSSNPVED